MPRWRQVLSALAAGYVIPYVSPVSYVRNCPGEIRHSFPFLFAIEPVPADARTLVIGVVLNTMVWAGLLVGVVIAAERLPVPGADRLAGALRAVADAGVWGLAVLAVVTAALTIGAVDPTLAVGPGDVDTDACRHVTGHTRETNWWGPFRLSLYDFDRLG